MKTPIYQHDATLAIIEERLRAVAAKSAEVYVEALTKDFESTTQPEE